MTAQIAPKIQPVNNREDLIRAAGKLVKVEKEVVLYVGQFGQYNLFVCRDGEANSVLAIPDEGLSLPGNGKIHRFPGASIGYVSKYRVSCKDPTERYIASILEGKLNDAERSQ